MRSRTVKGWQSREHEKQFIGWQMSGWFDVETDVGLIVLSHQDYLLVGIKTIELIRSIVS